MIYRERDGRYRTGEELLRPARLRALAARLERVVWRPKMPDRKRAIEFAAGRLADEARAAADELERLHGTPSVWFELSPGHAASAALADPRQRDDDDDDHDEEEGEEEEDASPSSDRLGAELDEGEDERRATIRWFVTETDFGFESDLAEGRGALLASLGRIGSDWPHYSL